ncbi:synaptogyrin-4 [Ambystoma mexicanum]|uniref:synaptogyrin-4 n=1 Tax=Ambystoma mexicanum TaxID=8296 RepID=UPI0037E7E949
MGCLQALRDVTNNALVLFMFRPLTIVRMAAWIMSLIVAGSLVNGGYQNLPSTSKLHCILNDNFRACSFGIALGILGFMWCCLFLALDASEAFIVQPKVLRCIMITDLIISIIWSILWFVGFCFLANQWALTNSNSYPMGGDSARASIAFSFFSILCWIVLVYLTGSRLRSTPSRGYSRSLDEGIEPNLGKLTPTSSVEFHSTPTGMTASYQLNPALGGINPLSKY